MHSKNALLQFFLLIVFFCTTQKTFGSTEGIRFYIEKDLNTLKISDSEYADKLSELNRLLNLCQESFVKYDTTTSKVYEQFSLLSQESRDFEKALNYKLAELEILEHFNIQSKLAVCYTQLAKSYSQLSEHYKSEAYYLKGLELKKELFDHSYFENYTGLCHSYYEQGKFNLLKRYAEYALEIAKNPDQILDSYYYIFLSHAQLKEVEKGYEILAKAEAMARKQNKVFKLGRVICNKGWMTAIEGNQKKSLSIFKKSIDYYLQGIEIIELSDNENKDIDLAFHFSTLSNLYRRARSNEESFIYARKAIQKAADFYGEDYNQDMGTLYQNLASKYIKIKRDRENGLKYTQAAIKCYMKDDSLDDYEKLISKEELFKVNQKWRLLISLKEKSLYYAHRYLDSKNKEDLINAERQIGNAVDMIDIMRAEMSDSDTKFFWRAKTKLIYDISIELAEWLGDKNKMYYYIEKSKSILLLDELNLKEATKLIPEQLVAREKTLLEDYTKSTEDSHFYFSKYKLFVDSLSLTYPAYYKYKFDTEIPQIQEVQNSIIDDSTNLIQYYNAEDSLYLLNITHDNVELVTSPRPKELEEDVEKFLSYIGNKDSLEFKAEYFKFLKLSHKLYQQLYEPIKAKRKNTIVVGDGPISYLPFEALVKNDDLSSPQYLIEDHSFSFASSVSVLQKMKSKKANKFNSLLVVCPEDFEDVNLELLLISDKEVESLKKISDCKILKQKEATLKNFTKESLDYDVIHFSSHSGVNQETKQPWIAFQDSIIELNEIYKMNLNASLVTLSSCKSFDGQYQAGEGINSLARAFLFANASSVIGSLWNLNEVSGYEILNTFYSNLKNEQNKPEALRHAKLKYIRDNPYKSPYHWAPLVCIGDNSKLKSQTPLKIKWILPLMLLFSFLGFRLLSKKH